MKVMLDVPTTMVTALQAHAEAKGLSVEEYLLTLVERDALAPPPGSEKWTLQDALDYAGPLPDEPGIACAVAGQEALSRIWNSPEDNAAWPAI